MKYDTTNKEDLRQRIQNEILRPDDNDAENERDDSRQSDVSGDTIVGPWLVRFPKLGELCFVLLKSEGEIEDAEAIDNPIPVQVIVALFCVFVSALVWKWCYCAGLDK
jgi:hypothetical protein